MAYGLEITNADGTLAFSTRDTAASIVAIVEKVGTFTGTVSIPTFDSTRGAWVVTFDTSAGSATTAWGAPTVIWDNATKILTLSPMAVVYPAGSVPSDYKVIFFHYKGV